MRNWIGSLAVAIAALCTCAVGCGRARVASLYGGPGSLQIVTSPERVEAYQVGPAQRRTGRMEDYADRLINPVPVDAAHAKRLSAILADPNTYWFGAAKACIFNPNVVYRFTRGNKSLDVVLCFGCDELAVFRNGKMSGLEDFDNQRPAILQITQSVYPDDAFLHALKP